MASSKKKVSKKATTKAPALKAAKPSKKASTKKPAKKVSKKAT